MAVILSGIAILLSLLSSWVARNKASKRGLDEIRSKNSELQKQLNDLQKQLNIVTERTAPETPPVPSLSQAAGASSEISMLKIEFECIRRDLQANSQILSSLSQAIESIKEEQSSLGNAATTAPDTIRQQLIPDIELNGSAQGSSLFCSAGTFAGFKYELPAQAAEAASSNQSLPLPQPEPFDQVSQYYQDAIGRGDRQALRQMQFKELNISSESEDSLLRGNSSQATKLEAVLGGGSYMVVSSKGQYWLFPTAQTLDSFRMNQPQKGIFSYEREVLSKPVVKRPAEVRQEGDYWIISAHGVISVPG